MYRNVRRVFSFRRNFHRVRRAYWRVFRSRRQIRSGKPYKYASAHRRRPSRLIYVYLDAVQILRR